jgi:hypothetical protein
MKLITSENHSRLSKWNFVDLRRKCYSPNLCPQFEDPIIYYLVLRTWRAVVNMICIKFYSVSEYVATEYEIEIGIIYS